MSSSWLPFNFNFSFPNLTPPLSIQRRFISFLLRRSLGHFLKPGQLDIDQIDAQIGNGFVEVKDLELDCNAINSLLDGQPLQLQTGTITSVTARIPWPNPFSSTVGLSLSGLRLKLGVSETTNVSWNAIHADELAESVASAAETFIHNELTKKEEAQLRQSAHFERGAFDDIPSSMNPLSDQDQEPSHKPISDPEGVSIFARLFESLLARFDFDASESQISVVHDDVTISLCVSRIRYLTTGESCDFSKASDIGEKRSLQVAGVTITMQDNSSPSFPPLNPEDVQTSTPALPFTMTRYASDSELDDETQTMMSQSLVSLPPHPLGRPTGPPSPALSTVSSVSATSSMYKSAISASGTSPVLHQSPVETGAHTPHRPSQRTILAVSEPILLQLTTPPVAARDSLSANDESPSSREGKERDSAQTSENVKLDISMGIIAISLDARCVYGLLSFADAFTSVLRRSTDEHPRFEELQPSPFDRLDFSLTLKGLVVLVLGGSVDGPQEESFVSQFYEKPLVPPYIPNGYTRLHVELVKVALKTEASADQHTSCTSLQSSPVFPSSFPQPQSSRNSFVSCTISDFSILAFHSQELSPGRASVNGKSNTSSPFLLTDRNLGSSYRFPSTRSGASAGRHIHPHSDEDKNIVLPNIDVVDWSSERARGHSASLRLWRTRTMAPSHYQNVSGGLGAGLMSSVGIPSSPAWAMRRHFTVDSPSSKPKNTPAVFARLQLGKGVSFTSITMETLPVHLFINLDAVRSVSEFLETALPSTSNDLATEPPSLSSSWNQGNGDEGEDKSLSPPTFVEERRRLEKLVLEDLELDMDYRQAGDTTPRRRASPPRMKPTDRRIKHHSSPQFNLLIPLLRVELRVPPPSNRPPRTGSLLLDLHLVHFSRSAPHSPSDHRVPWFDVREKGIAGLEEWFNDPASQPMSLETRRVILAYADLNQLTAETVLSLGPLGDTRSETAHDGDNRPVLFPLILFRNRDPIGKEFRQSQCTAILTRVPSFHVVMNKPCLDGLQLWVDDVTQWAARSSNGRISGNTTGGQVSRTNSLIGSRYFIQRTGSGSTENEAASADDPRTTRSEVVVKTCVSEAFVRMVMPMGGSVEPGSNRLLDICASDIDALVEVKPEGKDETVISLNVLDMNVKEHLSTGPHDVLTSRSMSINRDNSSVFKVRFRSVSLPGSIAKESKVHMTLNGLTLYIRSDTAWVSDVLSFVKAPPGAFDSVIPSERTHILADISECAFRVMPPTRPSSLVLSLGHVNISTDVVGESQETVLYSSISDLSMLLNDDSHTLTDKLGVGLETDAGYWMRQGYALIASVQDLTLHLEHNAKAIPANAQVAINGMLLYVHLCADTISGITGFITDLQSIIPVNADLASAHPKLPRRATSVSQSQSSRLLRSLDEQAFRRQPVIGPLPDMINDDLPKNPEYLDASFGAAAGFRALDEEEDKEFYPEDVNTTSQSSENIIAKHGGETIKVMCSPIEIVENFFDTLTPNPLDFAAEHGDTSVRIRAQDCDVHLLLYDGYDWERTKKAIQEEVKRMRRRLAKIRQLLASGQTYDPNIDEINSVLFNSVYVGLEQDAESLEGEALIAAIDDELAVDASDVASESSWQSFNPSRKARSEASKMKLRLNKLDRARGPSIEFTLRGMAVDFDQYLPDANLASRFLSTVRDLEILDHIKTSTWSTFLTELRSDSRGNIRETDSNMARVELQMLQPFQDHTDQEARLKAKILPLRLHVDQDALDFLKKFFSFTDGDSTASPSPENEIFFQHVEIFPIDIKLDYKPRRVDYRALKEGRTIELMNFFHFDGSEMTLRHITLKGITGWARMFDTLNDLWTPDVKANQLVDVISGVSPIRSAVNVGSGVADLVLLPIAQYKKDGRIIRGLQKGTTAFVKSTAMEAIKLGARLATGTQVVLEQTENVLGAQFSSPVTAEALQPPGTSDPFEGRSDEDGTSAEDLYSRYAEQPTNVREGVQSAYRTLSQNLKYAGQTILAVPMEVYERSGKEGPARAVIRAVPIAVLKPMIGASGAISKTLLGLHNTLDPQAQIDTETKYKHR